MWSTTYLALQLVFNWTEWIQIWISFRWNDKFTKWIWDTNDTSPMKHTMQPGIFQKWIYNLEWLEIHTCLFIYNLGDQNIPSRWLESLQSVEPMAEGVEEPSMHQKPASTLSSCPDVEESDDDFEMEQPRQLQDPQFIRVESLRAQRTFTIHLIDISMAATPPPVSITVFASAIKGCSGGIMFWGCPSVRPYVPRRYCFISRTTGNVTYKVNDSVYHHRKTTRSRS